MENQVKIQIKTKVNAPLSQVWRSWTSPEHIVNWNFASEDWHCPEAHLDLKPGGQFSYRMAAKNGSQAFDFKGEFEEVIPMKLIKSHLDDGRKLQVNFVQMENHVLVEEEFEADSSHSVELQKAGWQAILENFKSYTESLAEMHRLHYDIQIVAPAVKVYDVMLSPNTYSQWTSEFHPGSYYKGKWEEGEKIYFIGPDASGMDSGMVAKVTKAVPGQIASVEHQGLLDKGKEITEGPVVQGWAGALEEYKFVEKDGVTTVHVTVDTNKEFKAYFEETWPKALELLKSICQTNN